MLQKFLCQVGAGKGCGVRRPWWCNFEKYVEIETLTRLRQRTPVANDPYVFSWSWSFLARTGGLMAQIYKNVQSEPGLRFAASIIMRLLSCHGAN